MQTWKAQSDEDYCPEEKPRHLYLVLDEWSGGYSIRKIDLFGGSNLEYCLPSASSKLELDPSASSTLSKLPLRLSELFELETLPPAFKCEGPPSASSKLELEPLASSKLELQYVLKTLPPALFKFEGPRSNPWHFAGAFDSKILAMQPMHSWFISNSTVGVPVYDVHTRSLMIGPRQVLDPVDPIYIPVDGRLFALSAGSFQLLNPPPCDEDDFEWMWHTLPDPPFQREHVTSYAVHRDGRTIFVSTEGKGCAPATFSFDTTQSEMRNTYMWKQLGQWRLAFDGRAYFVAELDALVGLNGEPGPRCRICSMDLASDKCDVNRLDQVVKFSKEGLFGSELSMGATLVNIGGSRFCIVDFDAVRVPSTSSIIASKVLIQFKTFSVSYDKHGDLTTRNLLSQEYIVPGEPSCKMLQHSVAFWM